eukprot:g4514.t1
MRDFFERAALEAELLVNEFNHLAQTDQAFVKSVGRAGLDTMWMVSDVTQCVAFFVMLYNLRRFRSLVGVSGQTVVAIAVARIVGMMGGIYEMRGQALSFWLFVLVDVVTTGVACVNVYSFWQLRLTYNQKEDDLLKGVMQKLGLRGAAAQYAGIYVGAACFTGVWKLICKSGILGRLSPHDNEEHESLHVGFHSIFADSLIMFGMMAQMHLTRRMGFIRALLGDFVILMGSHKVGLFFWWFLFGQLLLVDHADIQTLRLQLMAFEFINVLIYLDFWAFWVRSGAASWWSKRRRDEFVVLCDSV